MKDYKDTLNLPKTDFPMKAHLPEREPLILKKWEGLYKKLQKLTSDRPLYVLHDGPPYANGNIHIGHALNKILKDVINKYMLLSGYRVHYIPGWDCHGLPIEQQVEKELQAKNIKKEDISKQEFRKLCREYALKFVNIQREEFKRLGVLGDWENPYLTMDPAYEACEVRELGKLFHKGLIIRSKKPVYWCIYDKTAEAEAEVEYYEREDPSIYVKLPLKGEENTFFAVWTTTPWTLPANMGLMVGEDYTYAYYQVGKETYIIAEDLVENFQNTTGLKGSITKKVKGKELIGLSYIRPYAQEEGKVYPSEFVELSTGTGIVHMAPGHGREDYIVGLRYGLEPYSPVDDEGRFTQEAPPFLRSVRVFDANRLIVEDLKKRGLLIYEGRITHSYPHCWRCKNPVIFRSTPQWFISMEGKVNGKTLRELALEEIEKVNWIPSYGKNRIRSMVEARPDWCISRQRYWGVPIAVFYCKKCTSVITDREVFEHVAKLIESSPKGSDIWFELSEKELLPEGYKCPNCGSEDFKKEEDILDVWFDSGSSHACVLRRLGIDTADMYLEGSDQHRGWFQSSLLESVASYSKAPYRAVLTHGFTVDEQGRKMSKSLGNVISPQEIIKQYGADILRLWVVSEDYTEDVKLGKSILQRIVEDYKKIRNTLRFLLANLYDFSPQRSIAYHQLHHFDRWMMSYLQMLLEEVGRFYREYAFHRVYQTIRNFCSVDLSSLYLDVLKDRLYIYAPDSWERLSAQTVLYELAIALTTSIAPFLSFTAEEVWEHLRNIDNRLPESVFMSKIPQSQESLIDRELLKDYEVLGRIREDVMRAIEQARRDKYINHPYEARVFLWGDVSLLEKYQDYLKFYFTVSQVELKEGGKYRLTAESLKGLHIGVDRAEGKKCPRCWVYYPEEEFVGEVCQRCANAIAKTGQRV
ncbi:MAG: isoleucine--tRNA ligase [Hydrogenobacter thermophilus]|uniref:isoleucine--tRNA ligase n=1 Tax=Hydrogenobacter thermophilus TaxID=940 RepID=UPI001C75AF34|nr:isoleucine--tRNA ligase [Hydrogenobacter thermophilus]QWK19785.1 MAG: isoleucine--tRNA ligase [Hydrogenobacter thermophilus]